jgi:hypothetical protein
VHELGAAFLEQLLDVFHDLPRLTGRISDGDVFARVEVLGDLTAQVYGPARDDCLRQVVVQALLGVRVLCIERTYAHMTPGGQAIGHAS